MKLWRKWEFQLMQILGFLPRYRLWCFGSICHQLFILFRLALAILWTELAFLHSFRVIDYRWANLAFAHQKLGVQLHTRFRCPCRNIRWWWFSMVSNHCKGYYLSDQHFLSSINPKYNNRICRIDKDLHKLFWNSKHKFCKF